jgi:hypothetical protein
MHAYVQPKLTMHASNGDAVAATLNRLFASPPPVIDQTTAEPAKWHCGTRPRARRVLGGPVLTVARPTPNAEVRIES